MSSYSVLKRVELTEGFLHSNSTTHKFLFGALAELVDNAVDACATNLHIDYVERRDLGGGSMVTFLDNGLGMDQEECHKALLFGCSSRRTINNMDKIGKYGNGLKSSTLRFAKDFMIFSKKLNILSIAFLSRTFLHAEKLENSSNVYIAVPSFDDLTYSPWFFDENEDLEQATRRHNIEMELIYKYSPFKNFDEIKKEFKKLNKQGTLVVIFNLLLNENGEPILKWNPEKSDIIIKNESDMGYADDVDLDFIPQERRSFRKYLSILYKTPKMKIFINEKKVKTTVLDRSLYWRREYNVTKKRDIKSIEDEIRDQENELRALRLEMNELKVKISNERDHDRFCGLISKNDIIEKRTSILARSLPELERQKQETDFITIAIGLNLKKRSQSGAFIYNQHRLLMMYKKVSRQLKNDPDYQGITIVVDAPYSVMVPKHDKQRLVNDSDFSFLKSAINDKLKLYMEEIRENVTSDFNKFWRYYGYTDDYDPNLLLPDELYAKRRDGVLPCLQQCNVCLKWRMWKSPLVEAYRQEDPEWNCRNIALRCDVPESFEEYFVKKESQRTLERDSSATPVVSRSSMSSALPRTPSLSVVSRSSISSPGSSLKILDIRSLSDPTQVVTYQSSTSATSARTLSSSTSCNLTLRQKIFRDLESSDDEHDEPLQTASLRRSSRLQEVQPSTSRYTEDDDKQSSLMPPPRAPPPLKTSKRSRSESIEVTQPKLNLNDQEMSQHPILKRYYNKSILSLTKLELLKFHTAKIRYLLEILTPEEPNLFKNVDSNEFFTAIRYHRYVEDKYVTEYNKLVERRRENPRPSKK